MEEIKIGLTKDEAQKILDIITKEPYKDVFLIVGKIQSQANEQLK